MNSCGRFALIGLAASASIAASALRADEAPQSVWEGVYTAAQAQRGAAAYASECVSCHMEDLAGDGGAIPPLAGQNFQNNWDKLALAELFDRIHSTMPQSNPGSLSSQQVADLIAFILSANKIPAGAKELTDDSSSLKSIQFDAKAPKH
jgi:cytochrome c553